MHFYVQNHVFSENKDVQTRKRENDVENDVDKPQKGTKMISNI